MAMKPVVKEIKTQQKGYIHTIRQKIGNVLKKIISLSNYSTEQCIIISIIYHIIYLFGNYVTTISFSI